MKIQKHVQYLFAALLPLLAFPFYVYVRYQQEIRNIDFQLEYIKEPWTEEQWIQSKLHGVLQNQIITDVEVLLAAFLMAAVILTVVLQFLPWFQKPLKDRLLVLQSLSLFSFS